MTLFPKQTPYEIIENSKFSIAMKVIKQLTGKTNELQVQLIKLKKEIIKLENLKKQNQSLKNEIEINRDKLRKNNSTKKNILVYSLALSLVSIIKILFYFKTF